MERAAGDDERGCAERDCAAARDVASPFLEVRSLTKSYDGRLALVPVEFSVEAGENLAIVGPSGCGKTTLLELLAGLIDPTGGEVIECGRVVSRVGWQLEPHRRSLGFLFQDLALWPHMTVRAHLAFALRSAVLRGGTPGGDDRIRRVLEQAGLDRLAERRPRELSGGERQRVAWARAVIGQPRLLLLDEPLTSLDPRLRGELLDWTIEYGSQPGRTLIVVSHDPEIARRMASRVLELG